VSKFDDLSLAELCDREVDLLHKQNDLRAEYELRQTAERYWELDTIVRQLAALQGAIRRRQQMMGVL